MMKYMYLLNEKKSQKTCVDKTVHVSVYHGTKYPFKASLLKKKKTVYKAFFFLLLKHVHLDDV